METDEGFFKWLKKPHSENEQVLLVDDESNTFEPLTNETLDHVISEINRWYDKRITENGANQL